MQSYNAILSFFAEERMVSSNDFVKLVEFALKNNYFQFNSLIIVGTPTSYKGCWVFEILDKIWKKKREEGGEWGVVGFFIFIKYWGQETSANYAR